MSKSKSQSKSKTVTPAKQSNTVFIVAALVVVVIGAAAAFFLVNPPAANTASVNTTDLMANEDPVLISPEAYNTEFAGVDHYLLDVRTPDEFNTSHIAGAHNISVDLIASRINELPTDKPIVVYCRSGNRSSQAAQILDDAGFTGVYDLGGTNQWTSAGYNLCIGC